jgi:uncharacterized protein involved in oxidation of intracellular sulfur
VNTIFIHATDIRLQVLLPFVSFILQAKCYEWGVFLHKHISHRGLIMKILIILNDPPYGTERCFNGLRLALALRKTEPKPELSVFLMADAVLCAKAGQTTPDGYYNLGRMIRGVASQARVLLCGNCLDTRGIDDKELLKNTTRSTMPELAQLTLEADKVLVF